MWRAARFLVFALIIGRLPAQSPTAQSPPLEQSALAAWREYDYPTAEKLYREAIVHSPSSAQAHAGLVSSLLEEKKLAEARRALQTALQVAPEAAAVLAVEGDVLLREGHLSEAEAAYQKALSHDQGSARAWFGLAKIAYMNSLHRTAKREINQAHELDPADPEIYDWWAVRQPRPERKKALEYMVDHPGHLSAERLNNLQSRLAFLIVLGDKQAWKLVSKADIAKVKLNRVLATPRADGLCPPGLRPTAVAVKMEINGKKTANLLVDTGATGVMLKKSVASRAGVRQIYDIATNGIGDEKAAPGYLGWASTVKVGPLQFENVPMTVVDQRFPDDVDGLIGLDVFDPFLVTLDLKNAELDLAPLPELPDDHKDLDGSWDRYIAPEMKDYQPVLHMSAHLLVPTSVDGGLPGLFFLDTGAFDSQVDLNVVSRDKLTAAPNLPVRGISGRVNNVFIANNVRIQFGHFVQDNFRMVAISMDKISDGEGIALNGILGFPLLSNFRMSIDYRDGLVKFDYKEGKR